MKEKIKNFGGLLALTLPDLTPQDGVTQLDPKTAFLNIIIYGLYFVGGIALIFIVYGGIMYITSGGDSEKTTKARNTLLYAILGIIVVVSAIFIINWAAGSGADELLPAT